MEGVVGRKVVVYRLPSKAAIKGNTKTVECRTKQRRKESNRELAQALEKVVVFSAQSSVCCFAVCC